MPSASQRHRRVRAQWLFACILAYRRGIAACSPARAVPAYRLVSKTDVFHPPSLPLPLPLPNALREFCVFIALALFVVTTNAPYCAMRCAASLMGGDRAAHSHCTEVDAKDLSAKVAAVKAKSHGGCHLAAAAAVAARQEQRLASGEMILPFAETEVYTSATQRPPEKPPRA